MRPNHLRILMGCQQSLHKQQSIPTLDGLEVLASYSPNLNGPVSSATDCTASRSTLNTSGFSIHFPETTLVRTTLLGMRDHSLRFRYSRVGKSPAFLSRSRSTSQIIAAASKLHLNTTARSSVACSGLRSQSVLIGFCKSR